MGSAGEAVAGAGARRAGRGAGRAGAGRRGAAGAVAGRAMPGRGGEKGKKTQPGVGFRSARAGEGEKASAPPTLLGTRIARQPPQNRRSVGRLSHRRGRWTHPSPPLAMPRHSIGRRAREYRATRSALSVSSARASLHLSRSQRTHRPALAGRPTSPAHAYVCVKWEPGVRRRGRGRVREGQSERTRRALFSPIARAPCPTKRCAHHAPTLKRTADGRSSHWKWRERVVVYARERVRGRDDCRREGKSGCGPALSSDRPSLTLPTSTFFLSHCFPRRARAATTPPSNTRPPPPP